MVEQLYGIVHGFFDLIDVDVILVFFELLKKKKEEHFFDFPLQYSHFIMPSSAFLAVFKQSTVSLLGALWSEYLCYVIKE